jgi:hypothetical protein
MTYVNDENENSPLQYKSKRARSPSVSSTKSRKRRSAREDVENAANAVAEVMHALAASITAPRVTRFDQCVEILNEMYSNDEITSADFLRISRKIMKESEYYAALFYGLPAKYRLDWLRDENLLDSD